MCTDMQDFRMRGPNVDSPSATTLKIETPKKGAPISGKPHMGASKN